MDKMEVSECQEQEHAQQLTSSQSRGVVTIAHTTGGPIYKLGEKSSGIRTRVNVQDFYQLRDQSYNSGRLFEDPEFPATDESIYFSKKPNFKCEWKRPREISKNAQFFVEGPSRFDIEQGSIGNCWFLAAAANLTLIKNFFYNVIPNDQGFDEKYAGIFHFRFWQYGRWVEVVVDDRLPTKNGKLVYTRSSETNEFWSAIFEKAYAKLYGSYEALDGGTICEAMVDFTGGVSERIDLSRITQDSLLSIMLKAYDRGSLMGCAINLANALVVLSSTAEDGEIKVRNSLANALVVLSSTAEDGEIKVRNSASANELEAETKDGLVKGHAYSVTKVKLFDFKTRRAEGQIPLIRLRNPWGQIEWKGPWSDNQVRFEPRPTHPSPAIQSIASLPDTLARSPEWRYVPEDEKKESGLTFDNDGEFFMSLKYFHSSFSELEICNLSADSLTTKTLHEEGNKRWEMSIFEGSWVRDLTAGGCGRFTVELVATWLALFENFCLGDPIRLQDQSTRISAALEFIDCCEKTLNGEQSFWRNPQYLITLTDADKDDGDGKCTILVALMQKNRRAQRKMGLEVLSIGFEIFHLADPSRTPKPLTAKFLAQSRAVASSLPFINLREVTCRVRLQPGVYCIVPSTYNPNEEGEFIIRVFSETKNYMEEHDENVGLSAVDERNAPNEQMTVFKVDDTQMTDAQKEYFKQIAGDDMEISWEELKDVLDMVIKPEGNNQGYSREVCRSLLALMDVDHSGKLSYQEFNVLWTDVGRWNGVFKLYDKDKSGCMSMLELRQALNSAGYRVNYGILSLLARRYGNKKNKISYKDFLLCAIRLKVMIEVKEGFINQINLCRDQGLNPGPPAQKSVTLPLDHQVTLKLHMFQKNVSGDSDTLTFTMNQWLEKTLYI
uniref:Calpain-B n=2 Tax=Timema TaxID=61471 RepID=A0A7R9FGU5_9NEOP|nr:unnamed protein product [Timema tahoe]